MMKKIWSFLDHWARGAAGWVTFHGNYVLAAYAPSPFPHHTPRSSLLSLHLPCESRGEGFSFEQVPGDPKLAQLSS